MTPVTLTYVLVVSRYSMRVTLAISALNGLYLLACNIHNAYITAKYREKIYIISGEQLGSEVGSIMIAKMALYRLT